MQKELSQKRLQLAATFGPAYGAAFFFSLFINLLTLAVPLHMLLIFDRVFTGRSPATLLFVTIVALGALLVMGLLEGLRSRLLTRLSLRLDATLTEPVLLSMFTPPGRPVPGTPPYERGTADVNTVKSFLGGTGIFAFFDLPWLPIYLLITFMLHPVIGWMSLGGALVMSAMLYLNELLTRRASRQLADSSQGADRLLNAARRNVHAVYAMGMLPEIVRRWRRQNSVDVGLETGMHRRTATNSAMNKSVRSALQVVILSVGAVLVIKNEITVGVMIVGSIMMGKALQPLDIVMAGWKQFQSAREAAHRLKEALGRNGGSAVAGVGWKGPVAVKGLLIDDLVLMLGGHEVLRGINLQLEPGMVLGVVGESGSAKSSLARTIVGFHSPAGGRIMFDGRDLARLAERERGELLGYLPQDVELMPVTVGENIGRLDDSDAPAIIEAAKLAGVHEMILHLPNGYDTPVAPRAANLSAGQRQRIALARALYRNPRLLVLDEPDANLDDEGSQALIRAIGAVRERGGVVVAISHRQWLADLADAVFEMENGEGTLNW